MKYNKGITSLAILLIILGIAVVGGAAYYVGKSTVPKSETPITITTPILTDQAPVTTAPTLPHYFGSKHWPPTIQTSSAAYACTLTHTEVGDTVQKTINGKTYCVTTSSDCGAGHCGSDYTYTRANGSGTKTATFSLEWNNGCGGYGGPGDPQFDECHAEQTTFFGNLDNLIDSLM